MPLYKNYSLGNFIAFNGSTFAAVSLLVFVASTQPFYLANVLGLTHKDNIGSIIGKLGFFDECVVLIAAPLVGALCDEINVRGKLNGIHVIVSGGFIIVSISLFSYAFAVSNLFDVFICRGIFALGVISVMTMATVMFTEVSDSDFLLFKLLLLSLPRLLDGSTNYDSTSESGDGNNESADPEVEDDERFFGNSSSSAKHSGKIAAAMGLSAGVGAIFSISFFLTLPAGLQEKWNLSGKNAIERSFMIVGLYAIIIAIVVPFFLYKRDTGIPVSGYAIGINDINGGRKSLKETISSYFHMLGKGLGIAKTDSRVQLAYVGSFLTRLANVVNAMFVPMLVFQYFYRNGLCSVGNKEPEGSQFDKISGQSIPSKDSCKEAYVFAAMLTGIGQAVSLVATPIWGILADNKRLGARRTLGAAAAMGMVACFSLCFSQLGLEVYNPKTAFTFVTILMMNVLTMGTLTSSMSILAKSVAEFEDKEIVGSISGLFGLIGGFGIILITLVGGYWSDLWIMGPFFMLGLFNLVAIVASALN